ncbi:uncharacterized protein [Engystomops pustulosus]|uniref:uncharacterized protein n=1 Tax=Engystomops pustulosus TaxID=76066 RepID=UPI003AFA2F3B
MQNQSHYNDQDTVLFSITLDGTMKIGPTPKHYRDDYPAQAFNLTTLENVSHVLCSPEGELFCVRDKDLYRGPIPSKKNVDWFSMARRVGKKDWGKCRILFFHPNGELYVTTINGKFYKGPQPDNEKVSWMNKQATKIKLSGLDNCETLFFDPHGDLYSVTKKDAIMKGKPPVTSQDYEEWLKTCTMVGGCGWLRLSHFMSFTPDGKLWSVDKQNGNLYSGIIPEDGRYLDNSQHLGQNFHQFRYFCFVKDKTISNIISFQFLPEHGQRVSENSEVIEERVYKNKESSVQLKHSFTFDKTVKSSSSFAHEHGFTFEAGAEVKFKAGVPFIGEGETDLKMNLNTTHTWSFTKTNESEVRFSSSSDVEVPPGKAIRVVAAVVKANLLVPYRAKVRTIFGSETEIEGTWNGVTHYNLTVTQKDE